jgi:subtilisin family serine protease
MSPLDLVNLTSLMERSSGRPEMMVGLIDGPVAVNHPHLATENIHEVQGRGRSACSEANSAACMHGTFVAGILSAKRNTEAPAICPNCTLLVRPIFAETTSASGQPSASPDELARAIIETVDAGARVINLSVAITQPSSDSERGLEGALNYSAKHGVIVVAAAGNQGTVGSSAITRHPCVIPVVACDLRGRPISYSNLGSSIGRRGLSAPGDGISSVGADRKPFTLGGTSVAAPFVTGAIALLQSEFPGVTATNLKLAIVQASAPQRASVVPPLLNAWGTYRLMLTGHAGA